MDWATLIIALIASLPGLLALRNSYKKTDADIASQMTTDALRIVDEYREMSSDAISRVKSLQREFDDYKVSTNNKLDEYDTELRSQEQAIESLNARNLKLQLILSIYLHQFTLRNIDPLIHPSKLDEVTLEELRLTAESLSNIEARREAK